MNLISLEAKINEMGGEFAFPPQISLNDVAAGALIAKEAGATVTDFKGNEGIFPKQILVTNGKLLDQLLPLM